MIKKKTIFYNPTTLSCIYTSLLKNREGGNLKFLKDDICISPLGITHRSQTRSHKDPHSPINTAMTDQVVTEGFEKENLKYHEVVGKGSAGLVYRGTLLDLAKNDSGSNKEDIEVAIKCINIYEKEGRRQLLNDIKSLVGIRGKGDHLSSPFLVSFYGAYLQESKDRPISNLYR